MCVNLARRIKHSVHLSFHNHSKALEQRKILFSELKRGQRTIEFFYKILGVIANEFGFVDAHLEPEPEDDIKTDFSNA